MKVRPADAIKKSHLAFNAHLEMIGDMKRKPHPGWQNVIRANKARLEAKRRRDPKIKLYKMMVGSGREFKRRKKELEEMGYL